MIDGIFLERCNDCHVRSNHIYHVEHGLHHKTDVSSLGDGISIKDNRIVGVGTGIYSDSTVAFVLQEISGNHVNAYLNGINMSNMSSTTISKNLIYKTNLSSQLDWAGISIAGVIQFLFGKPDRNA